MTDYKSIISEFTSEIENAVALPVLHEIKVKYLGKKGIISDLNRAVPSLPVEHRPLAGAEINNVRNSFNSIYDSKEAVLKKAEIDERLLSEKIDITLPSAGLSSGHLHPVYRVYDEIVSIFTSMGYSVATGPEAELDYYNFEALNMPKDHPARDMQDTFYLTENLVMRTHTSPVQVRTMLNSKPPVKIIAPGKAFRSDYDITHSPMFHQVEGLYVDENVSIGDLKGTLTHFLKHIFGSSIPVRFRSSFFPFTEPSMEVDMGCVACGGSGCRVCKNTGWLEIAGSGMVAPEVLEAVNIDPSKYTGFAFGMGIERIAMLKYKIDDLRLFFDNRLKFLEQF